MQPTGIGVLSYNDRPLLVECLGAIVATVPAGAPIVVYDDASFEDNVRQAERLFARAETIASPVNRGAAHGRNRIWRRFERLGVARAAVVDMDVIVRAGWLEALSAVMDAHEACAIAAFPGANVGFPVRADGCVAEVMSLCSLYRIDALDDFLGPDRVWGMDERLALLSHDSEMCQRMKRCSRWRTHLAAEDFFVHKHPHHSTRLPGIDGQRAADCRLWGELEARRGWAAGKEAV